MGRAGVLLCLLTAALVDAQGPAGRIAELKAEIAVLKASRRGGLRCGPLAEEVDVGVGGYRVNASAPAVLELAVKAAETLISLPNGKALRVRSNRSYEGVDLVDIDSMDVWSLVGANGLTALLCIAGVGIVAVLDYRFGILDSKLGSAKQGLRDYRDFLQEFQKVRGIVRGEVDEDTVKELAAQDRWAKLALDFRVAKEAGERSGDLADAVHTLMELRADDIARLKEVAEAKAHELLEHGKEVAEELVHRAEDAVRHAEDEYARGSERALRVRTLANDGGVRAGVTTLRGAVDAGLAARGDGTLVALQTGVHAVDIAKLKAAAGALRLPVAGERYTALAAGHIRAGAGMDTEKVGQLVVGEEIVALKSEIVDETVRLKFERGWVSLSAKSGKPVLELVAVD
jgi:hypothetical protein